VNFEKIKQYSALHSLSHPL